MLVLCLSVLLFVNLIMPLCSLSAQAHLLLWQSPDVGSCFAAVDE